MPLAISPIHIGYRKALLLKRIRNQNPLEEKHEITAEACGLRNRSSVSEHLDDLLQAGLVTREPWVAHLHRYFITDTGRRVLCEMGEGE